MVEERETAIMSDRIGIARASILEGSIRGSEMYHFVNTSVHLAGRGSDIANTDMKDIYSERREGEFI